MVFDINLVQRYKMKIRHANNLLKKNQINFISICKLCITLIIKYIYFIFFENI